MRIVSNVGVFLVHWSVDLGDLVWHLQVCCPHVASPSAYLSDLHFAYQLFCNLVVVEPHEAETSAAFWNRVSDDLILLNLAVLTEVVLEIGVCHLVVQAANEHFVSNWFVLRVFKLLKFSISSSFVETVVLWLVLRFWSSGRILFAFITWDWVWPWSASWALTFSIPTWITKWNNLPISFSTVFTVPIFSVLASFSVPSFTFVLLLFNDKRILRLWAITLPDFNSSALYKMGLLGMKHPLVEVFDSSTLLGILDIILSSHYLESNKGKAPAASWTFITHDSYINDSSYFVEVRFQIKLFSWIQNTTNKELHVDRFVSFGL